MGKNIKKRIKLIDEQELQLRKGKEKSRCECPHTDRGELDVVPNGKGPLQYKCKSCTKDINFKKIPENTEVRDGNNNEVRDVKVTVGLFDACDTIDNAIDTIKITLDLQNEKDKELLGELAVLQYRIRNQVTKLYGKALKKNQTDRKKNRSDYNDSSWSKPQMTR